MYDDIWAGTCGLFLPYLWRRPWPDPPPWWLLAAGIVGGIGAWMVFGNILGGGGVVPITIIAVIGGNFLVTIVDAAVGMLRGGAGVDAGR